MHKSCTAFKWESTAMVTLKHSCSNGKIGKLQISQWRIHTFKRAPQNAKSSTIQLSQVAPTLAIASHRQNAMVVPSTSINATSIHQPAQSNGNSRELCLGEDCAQSFEPKSLKATLFLDVSCSIVVARDKGKLWTGMVGKVSPYKKGSHPLLGPSPITQLLLLHLGPPVSRCERECNSLVC